MTNFITGAIGIAMMLAFLGIILWWVTATPLIIISAVVVAMMLYDFIQTLRNGERRSPY